MNTFKYDEKTVVIKNDDSDCYLSEFSDVDFLEYLRNLKLTGSYLIVGDEIAEEFIYSSLFCNAKKINAVTNQIKTSKNLEKMTQKNGCESTTSIFCIENNDEIPKSSGTSLVNLSLVIWKPTNHDVPLWLIKLLREKNPLLLIKGNASALENIEKNIFDMGYSPTRREKNILTFREYGSLYHEHKKYFDTNSYWQRRYRDGGSSGSGSYSRLAKFKARFLNDFLYKNKVRSVIELGCGDGAQLGLINYVNYVGFDVSECVVEKCKEKYRDDESKSFVSYDGSRIDSSEYKAELTVSLDVIYHLSNDVLYKSYLDNLFSLSKKYVVIYSNYNELYFDGVNEKAEYVRFRNLLDDITKMYPSWGLEAAEPNQYPFNISLPNKTSFADFLVFKQSSNSNVNWNDFNLKKILNQQNMNCEQNYTLAKQLKTISIEQNKLSDFNISLNNEISASTKQVDDKLSSVLQSFTKLNEMEKKLELHLNKINANNTQISNLKKLLEYKTLLIDESVENFFSQKKSHEADLFKRQQAFEKERSILLEQVRKITVNRDENKRKRDGHFKNLQIVRTENSELKSNIDILNELTLSHLRNYKELKESITYQIGYHFKRASSLIGLIKLPVALFRVYRTHKRRKAILNKAQEKVESPRLPSESFENSVKRKVVKEIVKELKVPAQYKVGEKNHKLVPNDERVVSLLDHEALFKVALNEESRVLIKLEPQENEQNYKEKSVCVSINAFSSSGEIVPIEGRKIYKSNTGQAFKYAYLNETYLICDFHLPTEVSIIHVSVYGNINQYNKRLMFKNIISMSFDEGEESTSQCVTSLLPEVSFFDGDITQSSRCLIYGDVSPNVIDGSSIWLTSVTSIISKATPVIVLLKDNVNVDKNVLSNVVEDNKITIVEPRDIGFNAPLSVIDAAAALRFIDENLPLVSSLIVRGFDICSAVIADKTFSGRFYPYLTDFYKIDNDGFKLDERKLKFLPSIVNNASAVLVQTLYIENKLKEICDFDFKAVHLPPSLPESIRDFAQPIELGKNIGEIHIGYTGKIQPNWGVEELLLWAEKLYCDGVSIIVHIATQKIRANIDKRERFIGKISRLLSLPFVRVYENFNRYECLGLMSEVDFVWCYRAPILEDNTVEISTKLIEGAVLSQKIICYPSKINKEFLSIDYPFFIRTYSDLKHCIQVESQFDFLKLAKKVSKDHSFERISSRFSHVLPINACKEKPKIVIAGTDLKFIRPFVSHLKSNCYRVYIDEWEWGGGNEVKSTQSLASSDILFCEWGLANAVWYSNNNINQKPLFVRVHAQEVRDKAKKFGFKINVDNVTKFIFVAEHIRDKAVQMFGWPIEKTVIIPNFIQDDLLPFYQRKRKVNLGMVGIIPTTKRFDRAVNLLEKLLDKGIDANLYIKGHRPEELPYMHSPGRIKELDYYYAIYKRIENDTKLKNAIHFDGWGNDVQIWYQKINYILSPSENESFHYSLVDGVCTGCIPIVWPWEGSRNIFLPDWVVNDVQEAFYKVLGSEKQTDLKTKAIQEANAEFLIRRFGASTIFSKLISTIDRLTDNV